MIKKYGLWVVLICLTLTQCKKNDGGDPDPSQENIFEFQVHADDLIDTVTAGHPSQVLEGYSFRYDNLNRVIGVQSHHYMNGPGYYDTTLNIRFDYNGNQMSPFHMEAWWHGFTGLEQSSVYFFYNPDGSKNRDSIINLNDPSQMAIRRFRFDSLFRYVNIEMVENNNPMPLLVDTVGYTGYNPNFLFSNKPASPGFDYVTQTASYVPLRNNPFSKLNIFPALFLDNYIASPDRLNSFTTVNGVIDFSQLGLVESVTLSENASAHEEHQFFSPLYDNKQRLTQRSMMQIVSGVSYLQQVNYHYKN